MTCLHRLLAGICQARTFIAGNAEMLKAVKERSVTALLLNVSGLTQLTFQVIVNTAQLTSLTESGCDELAS